MAAYSTAGHRFDPLTVRAELLRQRTSEKWRHYSPEVLPLWVAEMDVELAPPILAAVERALQAGDTGYHWGDAYQRAFAEFAEQTWGWTPDIDHMATVPDVMQGLMALLGMLLPAEGRVLVSSPVYPPLMEFPRAAGYQVETIGLTDQGRLDIDAIAEAFANLSRNQPVSTGSTTRLRGVYLLCNPHNPTGTVPTRAELVALAGLAQKHGIGLVADEIHSPLTSVPFTPIQTVTDDAYSLVSASKAWNLAGFKCALVMAGQDAPRPLSALPPHINGMIGHIAAIAHTAALTGAREWLDDLNAALAVRRELLAALLAHRAPAVKLQASEGTYLAWLDFRDCRDLDGQPLGPDPAKYLLRRANVALTSGVPFGGPGFARLNFAASEDLLVRAVDQLATALQPSDA